MISLRDTLSRFKLVPVIKLNDAKNAVPLAQALTEGGLSVAEVTFRTGTADQSIKSIGIYFVPTGGVSEQNVMEYLSFSKVVACGGTWMVTEKLIDSGDFKGITNITSNAVSLINGI